DCDASEYSGLLVFNREAVERRKEREKREREWQNELEISMEQSDPTGHGCSFSGLVPGDNCNECSRSCSSVKEMDMDKLAVDSGRSSTFNSAAGEKPAPSPESVKARIARSPKVVVRGSTVTIESSGINNKSSTQQLKARLHDLKGKSGRWVTSSSTDSDWSDLSNSNSDIVSIKDITKSSGKTCTANLAQKDIPKSPGKPSVANLTPRKSQEKLNCNETNDFNILVENSNTIGFSGKASSTKSSLHCQSVVTSSTTSLLQGDHPHAVIISKC
ncbi:unnamed protein product, partial [Meganyctiphanes norvegica]